MINNDLDLFTKLTKSEQEKNIFKLNKDQNILNIDKENQHYTSFFPFGLPQELQPLEKNNQFNKPESKIEEYGGMTRPESNVTLCNEQKAEDIFAKQEDLESIDEGKNVDQNFYVNENNIINLPFNYNCIFLGNPPNLYNMNSMLNFNFD